MSLNSHSHRFDPRWLFPAIGTDGAELYGAPDASPCSAAEESTNDPTRRDFDEALEQIGSDRVLGLSPLRGDRTRDALHSGEVAGFSGPQDSHPNALRPLRG